MNFAIRLHLFNPWNKQGESVRWPTISREPRTERVSGSNLLERSVFEILVISRSRQLPLIWRQRRHKEQDCPPSFSPQIASLHTDSVPPTQVSLDLLDHPSKATMAAVVHPHVCTVEVPHHVPGDKVADDIVVISYHNHGDGSAIDALLLPCRDLGKQPAATVLGVPSEDPIDQSADKTAPNLDDSLGHKSERDVPINSIFAAPSGNSAHQSAGDAALTPHHNPEDQSAVEAPVSTSNGTTHQAAENDHSTRSSLPGGELAEAILVTPHEDSEDQSAEVTSDHDPSHQPIGDTPVTSHRPEEKASEDKPADSNLTGSQQDLVDQPSDETLVIARHEADNSPAKEELQSQHRGSGTTLSDDYQLVSFDDLESETQEEVPKTSDHYPEAKSGKDVVLSASGKTSGDKPSGNASLELADETNHNDESNTLLVVQDETDNARAGETSIKPLNDPEHQIENGILVPDRSEDKFAENAFTVSNHDINAKEEGENLLATSEIAESHHSNDAVVLPDASGLKHTDEVAPSSDHESGRHRDDDVDLALSHHPEVRPVDNVLLASSHDSGNQSAGESLIIAYHDSKAQPAKDDLLIISNTLNHQPAIDPNLAISKEWNDQPEDDSLVVSPYAFAPHLLRLNTVSKPNQLLAKALTQMRAIRDDYATAAYIESFNWSTIVDHVKNLSEKAAYEWQPETFYIVVFRSRVKPNTNRVDLGLMDADAHEEAMESGGLLKYWFGVPDVNCRNLATCKFSRTTLSLEPSLTGPGIWRDQDDAKRGGRGPGHQRAMRAIVGLYTEWILERLRFVIEPGEHGGLKWSISDW